MSEPKQTKAAVTETEVREVERRHGTAVGAIFWGFAFILFGVLLLLDNMKVIEVNFMALWQLWPVLIIGAGMSLLSLRGWLAAVISVLLVAALGCLTWFVAVDGRYIESVAPTTSQTITGEMTTGQSLDVSVKTGAIALQLGSSDQLASYEAVMYSRGLTLQKTSEVENGVQKVTLATDFKRPFLPGSSANKLSLTLSRNLPLVLTVDSGASYLTGDLSALQLDKLAIKAGASSIDLKLGSTRPKLDVALETGVSRVILQLPANAGVRLTAENGLSHTSFEGLDKVSEKLWESANFASASHQITLTTKLGVSSFEITRY